MNKVNREAIKALLETEDNATISIYMPTHRFPTSEHISEDRIRLKNLVREAKEKLQKHGVDEGLIEQIATTIEDGYYENESFWQQMTEGLALFASPATVRYFNLPIECEEHVSAGDRYDITPLLAAMSCDQSYYLLALATHKPVLCAGDMYGIEKVDIELPESVETALNIDEMYANSKTDRASGYVGAKAHGQGDSKQAGQEEQLKFFRKIDEKIRSSEQVDSSLPFLLAGTEDELSDYREVSKMKHVLEGSLNGNYTEIPAHEVHAKAWPLISEELCETATKDMLEKITEMLGTGKASAGADDIVAAAQEGRVDTLLLAMFTITRDSIRASDEPVMKLVLPDAYEANAIAVCARATFDQGGTVCALNGDIMPEGASVAALYRY